MGLTRARRGTGRARARLRTERTRAARHSLSAKLVRVVLCLKFIINSVSMQNLSNLELRWDFLQCNIHYPIISLVPVSSVSHNFP